MGQMTEFVVIELCDPDGLILNRNDNVEIPLFSNVKKSNERFCKTDISAKLSYCSTISLTAFATDYHKFKI